MPVKAKLFQINPNKTKNTNKYACDSNWLEKQKKPIFLPHDLKSLGPCACASSILALGTNDKGLWRLNASALFFLAFQFVCLSHYSPTFLLVTLFLEKIPHTN